MMNIESDAIPGLSDTFPDLPEAVLAVLEKVPVVTFSGYVEASDDGVRLVADRRSSHSVQISENEILHRIKGCERPDDGGRSMIFVKGTAEVIWTAPAQLCQDNAILAYSWDDLDSDKGN